MTEPVVPVEGAGGHEGGRTDDRTVPRRVFLGIGVLLGVYALIYASTAYEEAGTVMLALSAVLALWFGTYLWLGQRARTVPVEPVEEVEEYLPHASVWPFVIGIGAATVFNGLVLGIWVVVPGLFLMAIGIGGWIGQTRRRD